jgi:2-dehydropantoate 2-reductase
MRILVWGAGAIGGAMAAWLVRAGHDITVVDTVAEHVAAINDIGLRITGPIAEFTARMRAFTPATVSGEWGTIMLATKAHHTEAATRALLPHLADTEPGVILHGSRAAVVVGEIDGRITQRVVAIRDAWLDFDDRAIVTPNIWGYLWGKEAYGAMLFATALTNASIADALAIPRYRPVYVALAREMLAVAEARHVTPESFDGFDPAAYLPNAAPDAAERSLDALVTHNRKSAKTHSGIWRDLAIRKRPTEVDAQLGIVVTLGRESGVPTPLTARLVTLIHDIERGTRPQSLDTLNALSDP